MPAAGEGVIAREHLVEAKDSSLLRQWLSLRRGFCRACCPAAEGEVHCRWLLGSYSEERARCAGLTALPSHRCIELAHWPQRRKGKSSGGAAGPLRF